MGLNELMVRIGGDDSGLESILQRLTRPFRNLANTTRSMSNQMTNSFSNMVTRTSSNVLRLDSTFRSRLSSIRGRINNALSGRNPAFNQFVMNCGRMSQSMIRFTSRAVNGLKTFGRGVLRATKQLKEMASAGGEKLTALGSSLTTKLTLPLGMAGGYMIKTAGDFQSALSSIKAVTGATGKDMTKVKKLALEMGAKTKYSALEAAGGIEELLKAGVSMKDVLGGGLEGALSLATAGELELADAAELASTVLNAFKKDQLSVAQAADILAGAANASATSVSELKFGLSACSAVASGVGMTFKDTATALAVFAQNGLKGSDAGTSLKTMLLNLTPNTSKAAAIFDSLGLMVYDTKNAFKFLANNGLRPASTKLDDIKKKFAELAQKMDEGKVGTKENEKAVQTMLSQYSSSAFYNAKGNLKSLAEISDLLTEKLKKMTPEKRQTTLKDMFGTDAIRAANILYTESGKGVKKMAKDMSKVKAADVAKERLNNFNGSLENLKGSIETIAIDLGMMMLPTLQKLADIAGIVVNAFGELPAPFKQATVIFGLLLAVIGPIVTAIGAVLTVFGSAALPVAALITLLVALATGFVVMAKKAGLFKIVGDGLKRVFAELKILFALLKPYIMTFISWIMPYIQTNFKIIAAIVKLAMDNVVRIIKAINLMIKGDFQGAWNQILIVIGNIGKQLFLVFGYIMNNIEAILSVGLKILLAAWNLGMSLMVLFIKWAWNKIKASTATAWASIKSAVMAGLNRIKNSTYSAFNTIKTAIVNAWNRVYNSTLGVWNNIKNTISSKISLVKSSVSGMVSYITNTLSGLAKKAYNWGANLIGGFLNGFKSKVKTVKNAALNLANTIGDYIRCYSPAKKGPLSKLYDWGKGLTEGYADGMLMNKKLLAMASQKAAMAVGVDLNAPRTERIRTNANTYNYVQQGAVVNQQMVDQIANMLTRKLKF